jgi:GNAT superfamily N-acetyltransferase
LAVYLSITEDVVTEDSVILKNNNTTVGFAYFSKGSMALEYIFVHPQFRRMGVGSLLVAKAEMACGGAVKPEDPITPLGKKFFQSRPGWIIE